ncbi:type II secretion system F family protein [Thermomonospora umbrina]|uniref:Tight adherence protein C n=1 Tax=Thermomonospora umbrina TaxID=111806 RepID=A0A3D9SM58_9ACTN|nr:type II secretion system F family protein [Thermomonospora umbrina]REE96817.1 tight adherence protein C [Thermomonospora umbrina]
MPNPLLLAGLSALGSAIFIVVLLVVRDRSEPQGVAGMVAAIEKDYAGRARPGERNGGRLGPPVMLALRLLAERLVPSDSGVRLQRRLDAAGNPAGWTPERVLAYKGLGLVLAGMVFGLVALGDGVGGALLLGLVGAVIGFFLPDVLLYNAALRRRDAIVRELPDVLDLLCVSVESGLGFDAALHRVAHSTGGPLAGELVRALQEVQIGKSREEALSALAARVAVEDLHAFVAALVQAAELGVPIGNVLREQAREMRVRRRQRAEEAAQKVAVKITFPVALCILPALFIVVLGPGILSIMSSSLF